ncbi:hypothetical protein Tco_1136775 [Tanacetum coccineum]
MEDDIFFNQSKYIKEMLKKFILEDFKPMKTSMSLDTKLTKDEECESVDSTKYQGMIGSLLYLTASRPDIIFSVCLCARFQEDPKTSHLEAVTMPIKTSDDHKNTRSYIPKMSMFSHIGFKCLLEISEQIVPRFILEFYSQYRINYDPDGEMFVEFVFQNQLFSFSLEEFGQILHIPYEGDCSFSNKWSLDDLPYSVPTDGPYQTNPPSPDDIKLLVQIKQQNVFYLIGHEQEIMVEENQILTHETNDIMKT